MKSMRTVCILLCSCMFLPLAAFSQQSSTGNESPGITISKFIDDLTVTGDLRIRFERREQDKAEGDDVNRERWRTRFRLGAVWVNSAENWEIGAGLTTGGEVGTTTNDTWNEDEFFETGDIRLDYAYVRHNLGCVTLVGGQQKNPFKTSWLLWDSDLRPTGLSVMYPKAPFFITAGGFDVRQYDDDYGIIYAIQAGANLDVQDITVLVAASVYDFNGEFDRRNRPNPDYEYTIIDLYTSAKMALSDVKLTFYGQVFDNIGAEGREGEGVLDDDLDPEEEDLGWVLGVAGGFGKFSAAYAYAQVGADSCVGGLKDATFGNGVSSTDLKGHKINLKYDFTKHFSLGGNIWIFEALERSNQNEVTQYELEVNYNF